MASMHSCEIKLPGTHNWRTSWRRRRWRRLSASAEPIRQVATTFTGVVHRLEYVDTIDGVRYVNNSMCTNVAAFENL